MGGKQTTYGVPQTLTPAAVGSVARALESILAEIQGGESFQRTRMTRVKRLSRDRLVSLLLHLAEEQLRTQHAHKHKLIALLDGLERPIVNRHGRTDV